MILHGHLYALLVALYDCLLTPLMRYIVFIPYCLLDDLVSRGNLVPEVF